MVPRRFPRRSENAADGGTPGVKGRRDGLLILREGCWRDTLGAFRSFHHELAGELERDMCIAVQKVFNSLLYCYNINITSYLRFDVACFWRLYNIQALN